MNKSERDVYKRQQLAALGLSRRTDAVRTATAMLRRENLEYRLHMELGLSLIHI